MTSNPIGIFDSGVGGLTVVKEIINILPRESIVYLGDTARVPYGTRSKETITKFALEMVEFLLSKKVKFLIAACNTISATCLKEISEYSPVPILGVVEPAVRSAASTSKNLKIGVIGTGATIKSNIYETEIKKINPKVKVKSSACPLFVSLAEEGLTTHPATKLIAKDYLSKFKGVDTLVLGCTHYPLLSGVISQTVGRKVSLIDSALPTAEELKEILKEKGLLNASQKVKYQFFVTDAPDRVIKIATEFFGKPLPGGLKKVNLDELH